jgi:hypothetical protein
VDRELAASSRVTGSAKRAESAFRADPGDWLPLPARRRGLGQWTVTLHGPVLSRTVACRLGNPWVVRDGVWRSLAWHPEPEREDAVPFERLLPSFRGEVGVETAADDHVLVHVRGRYRPPGGLVGAAVDSGLRRVANQTAQRFVDEIAARLVTEQQAGVP